MLGLLFLYSKSAQMFTSKEIQRYDRHIRLDEILVSELQDWMKSDKKFNLIDIREEYEREDYKLNDTHFIPMGEMMNSLEKISEKIPTVIYCQTGNKSKAIFYMLKKQNFINCYSLMGGVNAWVNKEINK
jgi:rhodanese-related sulfurtransferase